MVFRFDDLGSKDTPRVNNETPARPGTSFSDLGASGEGANKKYDDWGSWALDLARTAGGQGALMGFGDELIAGVRSLISGRKYEELKGEERDAIDRFRRQNPKTAFAAELAGGLAVPGMGAAKFVAGGASLAGKAARAVPVGAGFGAVSGVGGAESNDPRDWMTSAGEGAKVGAVIAPMIPVAGRVLGSTLQRADTAAQAAANKEKAAQLYLADKLRSQNMTEADIASDLATGRKAAQFHTGETPHQVASRMLAEGKPEAEILKRLKSLQTEIKNKTAPLPETIADVAPVTQRVLRGVKVGGEADDIIEPFLSKRQAGDIDFTKGAEAGGQYGRLGEQMRLALRVSDEALADKLDKLVARRGSEADTLFDAARKGSQPFDLSKTLETYNLKAADMADPGQAEILRKAVRYFDQHGTAGESGKGMFAVDNISRFHNAKMALDDLIASSTVQEAGNLRRLLTGLKHDLMDSVFTARDGSTVNEAYRKALDKFATRSEVINAAKLGQDFAAGREQLTPKMWRAMSEAEKNAARAAWLHTTKQGMGGKAAGPTTDFTGELRKPNTADELRLMLPPSAGASERFPGGNREKLTELLTRETRISDTARKVLGNSSTAEKAVDAVDIGRLARVTRYIGNSTGAVQAAASSLADALEKMSAIKGERARYLAQKLLTTDQNEQREFLRQVRKTYGANTVRRINQIASDWAVAVETAFAGQAGRAEEAKK